LDTCRSFATWPFVALADEGGVEELLRAPLPGEDPVPLLDFVRGGGGVGDPDLADVPDFGTPFASFELGDDKAGDSDLRDAPDFGTPFASFEPDDDKACDRGKGEAPDFDGVFTSLPFIESLDDEWCDGDVFDLSELESETVLHDLDRPGKVGLSGGVFRGLGRFSKLPVPFLFGEGVESVEGICGDLVGVFFGVNGAMIVSSRQKTEGNPPALETELCEWILLTS